MKLAATSIYCFAALTIALAPIGTCAFNDQDVNGRSDIGGVSGYFSTDKALDSSTCILPNQPECLGSGSPRVITRPDYRGVPFAARSTRCLVGSQKVLTTLLGNLDLSRFNPTFTTIKAHEYHAEPRGRAGNVGVVNCPPIRRISYLEHVADCLSERGSHRINEGIRCLLDAYGVRRCFGDSDRIIVRSAWHGSYSNELSLSNLSDLANCGVRKIPIDVSLQTVGANKNTPPVTKGHDGCTKRSVATGKCVASEYKEQPRYMREIHVGSEITYHDKNIGDFADMSTEDIDVSGDAVHWFHLGGDVCMHNPPAYVTQSVPSVPKRDR